MLSTILQVVKIGSCSQMYKARMGLHDRQKYTYCWVQDTNKTFHERRGREIQTT